jgi:hypothetical protein
MQFSAAALLLLAFISFTESVEDNGPNLRGREIDDEEDGERADLLSEFRTADLSEIFQLGAPTWGGTGCPEGTVQVIVSPEDIDGEEGVEAVTVIFDAYIAETDTKRNRDYKSCALAIPLKAKPGIQVGIFQIDYRGNTYVPRGPGYMSQFRAEYFFSGMRGPTVRKVFGRSGGGHGLTGPDWGDFTITNDIAAIVWSRCGASTNFRINTSITAQKPLGGKDDTSIAIDTVDTTVKAAYTLRYFLMGRRCEY